jgi:hypothetical protein
MSLLELPITVKSKPLLLCYYSFFLLPLVGGKDITDNTAKVLETQEVAIYFVYIIMDNIAIFH